jgi:hypothetical protein
MKAYLGFLLSSAAGLALLTSAHAAPVTPAAGALPAAQSYGDLLEPVENPSAVLLADDLARANEPAPLLQLAQYHHHHHRYHHHHHHGFPGFGIRIAPPVYYGRHCYIRREVHFNRWGERVVRRVRVCD